MKDHKTLWPNTKFGGAMVSIDGALNIGWAIWDWTTKNRYEMIRPVATGVILDPARKLSWEERCDHVLEEFDAELMSRHGLFRALIEMPQLMEQRGAMVSARSGALVKLTIMVGRIYQLCHTMGMDVELVEVRDWKGQMSKKATDACVARRFGKSYLDDIPSDHTRDAVAMGLWAKGHFQGQQ